MGLFDETNAELLFIRHCHQCLGIQFDEDGWLHGGEWTNGKITITWGKRSITDPPCVNHPLFSSAMLPRDLDDRLCVYRSQLRAAGSTVDFRDRVLLTAILNFQVPAAEPAI